jgi:hypothetical protein
MRQGANSREGTAKRKLRGHGAIQVKESFSLICLRRGIASFCMSGKIKISGIHFPKCQSLILAKYQGGVAKKLLCFAQYSA